jgi:hypothetical protein
MLPQRREVLAESEGRLAASALPADERMCAQTLWPGAYVLGSDDAASAD